MFLFHFSAHIPIMRCIYSCPFSFPNNKIQTFAKRLFSGTGIGQYRQIRAALPAASKLICKANLLPRPFWLYWPIPSLVERVSQWAITKYPDFLNLCSALQKLYKQSYEHNDSYHNGSYAQERTSPVSFPSVSNPEQTAQYKEQSCKNRDKFFNGFNHSFLLPFS